MKDRGTALPFRWLSPESLNQSKFFVESDIYSFGILMWEVESDCRESPYYEIKDPLDVGKKILSAIGPTKSSTCPEELYSIMKLCWKLDRSQRAGVKLLWSVIDEYAKTTSKEITSEPIYFKKPIELEENNHRRKEYSEKLIYSSFDKLNENTNSQYTQIY